VNAKGLVLVVTGMLVLGLGTFLLSPFWSMAGLRQALCEGSPAELKRYADVNLLERGCLRAAKRRICRAADGPMPGSAWQVYRATEIEWLSTRTMQVYFMDRSGGELAIARFKRRGLHWQMVDLDC
jgi:hypothetical protein